MKKIILALFAIVSTTTFAQSLSVHVGDYYYALPGEEAIAELEVENLTNNDLEVIVTRTVLEGSPANYMCWFACHGPAVDVASPLIVPGDSIVDNFSGHVLSMPEEADFVIEYCFSLVSDHSDQTCVDVRYVSLSQYIGVEELTVDYGVYPNPANNKLNLNYSGTEEATFVLYDMLGNEVLVDRLNSSKEISLTSYQAGIYFYSFQIEGRNTEVQKLVISH